MLLIASATMWILGSAFLLFPHFGLPPWMHRAAMTLLCAEVVAVVIAHNLPGTVGGDGAYTVASADLPALAALLWALAVATGLRSRARQRRTTEAPEERSFTTRSR